MLVGLFIRESKQIFLKSFLGQYDCSGLWQC